MLSILRRYFYVVHCFSDVSYFSCFSHFSGARDNSCGSSNSSDSFKKRQRGWRGGKGLSLSFMLALSIFSSIGLSGCSTESGDQELTERTHFELVDWHVSGLWVINCPVAWIRVANYNPVPIKNITFQYDTYDVDGVHLDRGTYTVEETVDPGAVRNFIELYLGLVSLHSDKLSVKLVSVGRS